MSPQLSLSKRQFSESVGIGPRNGVWSVYVHFPWCLKRCAYCDFATSVAVEIPRQAYLASVIKELEIRAAQLQPAPIATVFFGGGTPSLWGAAAVGQILHWLNRWGGLAADAEITLEANPGAAEVGDLQAYAQAGINRVSAGIQSLNAERLRWLDRVHDADQARATIDRLAAMVGSGTLKSASCDLIFGVPGQSLAELQGDVDTVLAAGIPHLSAYSLTVEPNTPLAQRVARQQVAAPDEELSATMLEALPAMVASAGLQRYEVSNFAREHHRSRHNWAYWTGAHYLAVGVGAHGFVPQDGSCGMRYGNRRSATAYMRALEGSRLAQEFTETISPTEHYTELVMTGLRLAAGVNLHTLDQYAGAGAADRLRSNAAKTGLLGLELNEINGFMAVAPQALLHLDRIVRAVA